jgi:signal transduction histidine kinase
LRGLCSSGLLLVAILFSLGLASDHGAAGPRLAAVAGVAVLARLALVTPAREALGAFADALDLVLGLALVLTALVLTGGLASELYALLLVDLVLARAFLGAPAARFLAIATLLGMGLLMALPAGRGTAPPLTLLLRGVWPLAVLVVLELWEYRPATLEKPQTFSRPAPSAAREPAPRDKLLHDLRSPLTVVRLYADLLDEQARQGQPPPPSMVTNLRAEVEMMEGLLRPGEGTPAARAAAASRCDLLEIVQALSGTYRLAHQGRLRITFESDASALPVAADPLSVRRALRNVLDNAVKFTPAGGEVRVRAGQKGREAFVAVSDTGPGMGAEEREKVFDFRYRGEAAKSSGAAGSGLGLGVTRELLAAHGGRVTLASQPGRGSEVTILLPVA